MKIEGINYVTSKRISLDYFALTLFFTLYIILPEYFAIEISSSFPLLTASRCILILLFLCVIVKNKVNLYIPSAMILFFSVLLIVDLYHIFDDTSESIKSIFTLIVEQLFLFIVLYNLIKTKDMVIKALNLLVMTSGVMSILALFETIFGINLFYYLRTVSRVMLQASSERAGSLRAEASFGHPVYFAVYLVCIFPFSLYFYDKTEKRRYLFIAILNLIALLCTGTRGGIIALFFVIIGMVYYRQISLKKIKTRTIVLIVLAILIIVLILIAFPYIASYFYNVIASTLSIFGIDLSLASDFGSNSSGYASRLAQLSGLEWQNKHQALLFGFGAGANTNGDIAYYFNGVWQISTTIDIGYLGYILQFGVIGGIGYAILYIFLWNKALKNAKTEDPLYKTFVYFYIAYFISLLNCTGNSSMFWVITSLFLIYDILDKRESV